MTALWSSVGKIEVTAPRALAIITEKMIASLARGTDAKDRNHGVVGLFLLLVFRCAVLRSGAYSVLVGEDAAREVKSHSVLVAWHGLAAHGALHYDSHRYASRHSQHDTLRLLKAVK